jgi:hypothetical protein
MNIDNLLDIVDPDAAIYRIFPKRRFLELIRSRKNALVSPRLWDDPFENFFLRSEVVGPEGERISIEGIAKDWYGQCWTLNEDTDAMWRIYSHDKGGIKIKTTIRKLFNGFLRRERPVRQSEIPNRGGPILDGSADYRRHEQDQLLRYCLRGTGDGFCETAVHQAGGLPA